MQIEQSAARRVAEDRIEWSVISIGAGVIMVNSTLVGEQVPDPDAGIVESNNVVLNHITQSDIAIFDHFS